jgi:hypothetical protein
MDLERLEERRVLAPILAGINANDGTLLQANEVRHIAPTDLTFVFSKDDGIDPTTLDGIQILRSGFDGVFGNGNDVVITPGGKAIGNEPNEVIARFAERLPDDHYQVRIIGVGDDALKNLSGQAFNNGQNQTIPFELDLGPQVVAVVPQPITRVGGVLQQARNQIVVYFNEDDLDTALASNRFFYQLYFTGHGDQFDSSFNTVSNTDDGEAINPTNVVYNSSTNTAVLSFGTDLAQLPSGPGTYRLRIGNSEAKPLPPVEISVEDEPGSSFATASDVLGTLGEQSLIVASSIDAPPLPLIFPGSNRDPGHREVSSQFDKHVSDDGFDVVDGITTIKYNFRSNYGEDPLGNPLQNLITEAQKLRAREVFELYAHYLGVQFVETADEGFTIATGDLRAVDPTAITDPDIVQGAAGTIFGFGPTAVMNGGQRWNEEFGENWFREAMKQIGHLLGLGAAADLPEGTIMGGNADLTFGRAAEAIFPGDHDIVHGQHLYRLDGNDIDLYRFTVADTGFFTAETLAERLMDASSLDTVVRLYRQTEQGPQLIAQNDDYFSQDSYIAAVLEPGIYFLGVSSRGNDQYDPTIEDTGAGGTTQGDYMLRIRLRPNVSDGIRDTTGQLLDGDSDGIAGGIFHFWFRTATPSNTLIVDKTAAFGGAGSLTSPFNSIQTAMNAAGVGDIVRVVGNNLGDGNLTNDVAYEIGFRTNTFDSPLPDGGSDGLLRVARGVTLMVDAGAVFHMRRGAIVVGSSSVIDDDSGAAIQVLGTPMTPVIFTSLNDQSIGVDTNPLNTTPRSGDWGGILVRSDVDSAAGRFTYEDQGIFLSAIYHADMRYGGGVLSLDSIVGVVNPVTMIDSRPSVAFNRVTRSADAAMSATANSFLETTFHAPEFQTVPFTSDYSRVGPDIHDNLVTNNTTNGLFVGDVTSTSTQGHSLSGPGRWDDTDIVHVVADGLVVRGTPGGVTEDDATGDRSGRFDGRLVIDPGTVVKLEGSQIEVQMGASLLAEGTASRPVVITSLLDDRYGFGGTFDTNNDPFAPAPGDWGGILLGPTSHGSFDYAVLAYGGGVSPVQGSFTGFNAIEIHQAVARITHSVLEFNAAGTGGQAPESRFGRTANTPATIFVAGAQPIIVDNTFRGNESAVININVNALNHFLITDSGRATGTTDVIRSFPSNQGPLVRQNRVTDNKVNGMEVRGGTLTAEGVWDDVDIVHVVRDGIYIPNFHSFGGLRLQSSSEQSLVIKLLGEDAGFVTTGSAVGVPDHIGGSLQVIGQPGQPVVMTSLYDDTVGAGFDSSGRTQTDTNHGGRPNRTSEFRIDINFGPRIAQFPEVIQAVRKAADIWEEQLQDNFTVVIDVELGDLGGELFVGTEFGRTAQLFDTTVDQVSLDFNRVQQAMIDDAGAHESIVTQIPNFQQFRATLPDDAVSEFDIARTIRLTRANARALDFTGLTGITSAFQSDEIRDASVVINANLDLWDFDPTNGILTYREDFQSQMLRQMGTILGFTSGVDAVNAALNAGGPRSIEITPLDFFRFAPGGGAADFANAPRLLDPRIGSHVFYAGGDLDFRDLPFEGLAIGDIPLATGLRRGDELNDVYGAGFWRDDVLFRDDKLTIYPTIGVMDPVSYLRDEVLFVVDPNQSTQGISQDFTEADLTAFDVIGWDVVGGAPGDWEGIRIEQLSHDGNVPHISERELATSPTTVNATPATAQFLGQLAIDQKSGDENVRLGFQLQGLISQPKDVDVYSFSAVAGTRVWVDIDRTSSSLDSVAELVSATGAVLARSNNSNAEATDPNLLVGVAEPFTSQDFYTTNVHDAGMQLVLPGSAGVRGTYFVRVRSASGNLDNVTNGQTSGAYQLQIRLQAADEVPGVSVQFADIRYAETGVTIVGPPTRSPLGGEQTENNSLNDVLEEGQTEIVNMGMSLSPPDFIDHAELPYTVEAQDLGNLLATRQGATSVFGKLVTATDVDWYRFQVSYADLAQSFATSLFEPDEVGVVFDMDYGDGLNRPDTTLAVYDQLGTLLYYSDASNVAADRPAPGAGSDVTDLSRGSVGARDPFIGPVVLEAGRELEEDDLFFSFFGEGTYYVAISSALLAPVQVADGTAPLSNILGLPGRGQVVEGAIPGSTAYDLNVNIPPGAILTGEYQLEIRTVEIPAGGFNQQNATAGDSNREREQGQITISANTIRDSRHWGIAVEDGLRDFPVYLGDTIDLFFEDEVEQFSQRLYRSQPHHQFTTGEYIPHAGTNRALPDLNEERLIPGITISNNVVSGGFDGGLRIHGDPNGVVLTVYNVALIANDELALDLEGEEFTLWDHQGRSQTFQFGSADPGEIPIRFDTAGPEAPSPPDTFQTVSTLPTDTFDLASEIEHAIRLSDLDVKVYRGGHSGQLRGLFDLVDTLFVEGVREIGNPDIFAGRSSVFLQDDPDDPPFPQMNAEMVQQGAVPYARVVNNTVVGRGGSLFDGNGVGDVGVLIEDNASPTLMNNIISNFAVGIRSDLTSTDQNIQRRTFVGAGTIGQEEFLVTQIEQDFYSNGDIPLEVRLRAAGHGFGFIFDESFTLAPDLRDYDSSFTDYLGARPTVIGATVYQGNVRNTDRVGVGDFAIRLNNSDPLFVDPAKGNFFLAEGTRAIDSSLDFLQERTSVRAVMNAVGIESAGIAAPNTDVHGILRVDDPSVEPPSGVGNNVFKDRGALERADFVGPTASISSPADNDPEGIDQDSTLNSIAIFNQVLTAFEISLADRATPADPVFGSGIDDLSVTPDAVTIMRDDQTLVQIVDYTVSYDATNNVIRLTPVAGIWQPGHVYTVVLDNTAIRDLANNLLQANRADGSTQFAIQTGAGLDYGDAPDPTFPTLRDSNGARHLIDQTVFLGEGVDLEVNGSPSPLANADELDDGVTFNSILLPDATIDLTVEASTAGFLSAWIDFNRDGDWNDSGEQIFFDQPLVAGANRLRVARVPQLVSFGDSYARFRFSTATGLSPVGEAPDGEVEDYFVSILGNPWQNPSNPSDVNASGSISPIDAVLVINELSEFEFADPDTGQLPIPRTGTGEPFLDVNGDGFVSPIDAVRVINDLPQNIPPAGVGGGVDDTLDAIALDVARVWGTDGPQEEEDP